MTATNGYAAYMTPFVWMFIKTYEGLRKAILNTKQISTLIQMEYSAFEEATVPINTFVLKNKSDSEAEGTYLKLSDFKGGMDVQKKYVLKAVSDPSVGYLYRTKQTNFEKIPGSPIAYWASKPLISDFEIGIPLKDLVDPKVGLQTGDNSRFLRQWFEVNVHNISFNTKSTAESLRSIKKWFPYNKGGSYRKWYGNFDYIVNWQHDGFEIKHFTFANGKQRSVIRNSNYYFREAITWSKISSGKISFRHVPVGSLFDVAGTSLFSNEPYKLEILLGFLNSNTAMDILAFLSPTLNYEIGQIAALPVLPNKREFLVRNLTRDNEQISKSDWNVSEVSWDFWYFPFVEYIAEHQKSPPAKFLTLFEFCGKYVPIQFRRLIFHGKLSKTR